MVIGDGALLGVVQVDLQVAGQQVDLGDAAAAVGGLHNGARLGGGAQQILVGGLLVLQAAHQAAAGAADLGGVEGKALLLGHFDGNGLELAQKAGAAEGASADAQSSQHFGFVPHADLPQLDAGAEHPGQLLDQLAEIHPAVGGKVEQDLTAVKGVLHLHQLHFQLAQGNLFLRDAERLLLLFAVFLHPAQVLRRGGPGHLFQRLYHLFGVDLTVGDGDGAAFGAAGGLHHHRLSHAVAAAVGVKIIDLADFLKSDADNFCHKRYSFIFLTSGMCEFFRGPFCPFRPWPPLSGGTGWSAAR